MGSESNNTLLLLTLIGGLLVGGLLGMLCGPAIMIPLHTTIDNFIEYFSKPQEEPAGTHSNLPSENPPQS